MKGKSGTEWTLRDSGADTIDLMCLAADIMDRERERTGLSPPETWAAISGDDHASVKARTEFIRRYLPEIAPALYASETPTDKQPHKDLGFGDLGGGLAVFFALLRASSGAPSPTSAETTRPDQTDPAATE
jgi:hypothetical protein